VLVPDPQACGEEAKVGLYEMTQSRHSRTVQTNAFVADSDVAKRSICPLHLACTIGSFTAFQPYVGACAFLVQPKSIAKTISIQEGNDGESR